MDRLISEQAVLDAICKVCEVKVKPSECRYRKGLFGGCQKYEAIKAIPSAEPKTRNCEDCKHFRKLPLHTSTIGKCIHHTGLCPKGDWYCADFESQESEEQR